MIWNSAPIMITIDLTIILIACLAVGALYKHRAQVIALNVVRTVSMIAFGLLIIASLYLADAYTMLVMPLYTTQEAAMAAMATIHLNWSWVGIFFGVICIFTALSRLVGKLIPQIVEGIVATNQAKEELQAEFDRRSAAEQALRKAYTDLESRVEERTRELRESEEKYHTIFDNAQTGIGRTRLNDGKVLMANEKLAEMFGYDSTGEFIAEFVFAKHYAAPDEREKLIANYESGDAQTFDVDFTRKDGSVITVSAYGNVDHNAGHVDFVLADITEQKRSEEARQESEAHMASIAENLPGIIFRRVLHGDGTVTFPYASPKMEQIFGLTPETIVANPEKLINAIHPEDREAWFDALRQSAETFTPFEFENRIRDTEGNVRWMRTIADVSRSESDDVIWDGVSLDVTDRKHAEEALREAKEQAEFANRSKSEFLANMSHELRTPLNAIIGFSEMMRMETHGPVGDAHYREYVRDIYDSGTHLLSLINDILDLSKIEAGELALKEEVVDVAQAVSACRRIIEGRVKEAGVTLATLLGDDLPRLRSDKRAVKQIILNLLSNAVKFTPAGGKVTVHAEIEEDGCFALSVSDTGIGIDADDIPKVLTSFSQVDSSLSRDHEGTGLGLPLARSLVELHGGTIELESELSAGTIATIHFPAERVLDDPAKTKGYGVKASAAQ